MHPQEAASLVVRLEELFKGILSAEHELVQSLLERFPYTTAEVVISRFAEETSTFDRAKLRTMLREEHSRRSPRASLTPQWKAAREAETKAMDELLARTSKRRLDGAVKEARKKYADVFRLLQADPLQSEMGKALIYGELMKQQHN